MNSINFKDAAKLAMKNRNKLRKDGECSCYACVKSFKVADIKEWTDAKQTAICPHCLGGETFVATPHGYKMIKDLVGDERFLVYAYNFSTKDYTLAWASDARKTKKAKTLKIILDDGNAPICTPDHRILNRDGGWIHAEDLEEGDELMPFYRLSANQDLTKLKTNQYARIYTHNKGWVHERQFVDEWSTGKDDPKMKIVNKYCRLIAEGLGVRDVLKLTGSDFKTIKSRLEKCGFSNAEVKWLGKKKDRRRVVGIQQGNEIDVYDLTVDKHHNFCTNWGVVHNCGTDAVIPDAHSEELLSQMKNYWFKKNG